MTVVEILRKAAEEIRKGFAKGSRHTQNGEDWKPGVCAIGAFENVLGRYGRTYTMLDSGTPTREPIMAEAVKALAEHLPHTHIFNPSSSYQPTLFDKELWYIADWNNGNDQTQEGVASKMEWVADQVERGGVTH